MKQRLLSLRLPETTMHSILRKPQQSPTGLPPGNPRPPNQVTSDCTASLSRPRNGSPRPRTKHTAPAGAFVAMVILRLLICSDTVLQSERTRSSSPNSPVGLRTRHWLCQQSSSPSIPAPPRPPLPRPPLLLLLPLRCQREHSFSGVWHNLTSPQASTLGLCPLSTFT